MDRLIQKIFVAGFYKKYSGLFLLIGLLFVGLCPPGQHWRLIVNIALSTTASWQSLILTIILSFLYLYAVVGYVRSVHCDVSYNFLSYSFTAMSRIAQDTNLVIALLLSTFPLLFMIGTAAVVGYATGSILFTSLLLLAMATGLTYSFLVVRRFSEPLFVYEKLDQWLDLGSQLGNSYATLGIRYFLSFQRRSYLLAKLLSYMVVTVVFFIYSELKEHEGVIMLALTAIGMTHVPVLSGQFLFEQEDLALWRNLPTRKITRWLHLFLRIVVIFLPEAVWLLYRYPSVDVVVLLFYLWAFAFFLYHLFFLFPIGKDVNSWLFFLFFGLAIISPLAVMEPLIPSFMAFSAVLYWSYNQ